MKVKELLEQVTFKTIFEYIGKFTGGFYYENFISAAETYDALLNKDHQPVNPEPAAKYTLEKKVALYKKLPPDCELPDGAIAAEFYGLYTAKGRSYPISSRYVKNVVDFSECEIIVHDYEASDECAALLVLSFSVLHKEIKSLYGDISSMHYIHGLKLIPPEADDEED